MFASLLLMLGGLLGSIFALVQKSATLDKTIWEFLRSVPAEWALVASLGTAVLGVVALRTQRSVWAWLGCALALGSLAFLGLVPVLGLVAAVFLMISAAEGEETRAGGRRLHADQWPDKALAASLFLVVGGLLAILQGILLFAGKLEPIVFAGTPTAALLSLAFGAAGLAGGADAYRVRRPWSIVVASILVVASLAFAVGGPLLGAAALVFVWLAGRENEFP